MRLIIMCCLLFISCVSIADSKVYRWKDDNGNWVFSDVPHKGAQEIQLNKSMTMPAIDTKILNTQSLQQGISYTANITSPNNEQTLRENTGTIYVTGQIEPSFTNGLKVQLTLNGKATGPMQTSTTFVLNNVPRGEHNLVLKLYNAQGKTLAQSDSTTFFLHRKSVGN
ncbi:DUF4124 domain-containing protein [Pseudoalteromonas aurantia]|uniref:DUF4124 domain-containing protein n=1 Tax=Pseudoalteromonas aurantia TaxID=43654 RepID=A0A5S3V1A3_9GAMM|nr:DUF4124 domain-containing protein [Pseudoalteromonas aurantia]TMO57800.1 DUF4124 domain-containing protein [Pseudoalteromonas aurantia]TMO63497.1 DUF4124 domain-containing protein [Pseudoalteromonas aurantia]TMO72961.1 DUF4124 domain-containing protein [Pseudoalteromonas aurantia]